MNDTIDQNILERVNPVFNTAKMTLFQLSDAGDCDAAAIASKLGLTLEDTQNSATSKALPEQVIASEITMDIRFNTMGKLSEESRCPLHVDLPCGYTPRAIDFSRKGLRFIGMDLPAAVAEAEPAIMSLIEPDHQDLVKFAGVDATNYESLEAALENERGEVCITTEGLMMYFTDSETGAFCDNIRHLLEKHGGVWFTADPEISLVYVMILKAICGERFMEIMANAKRQTQDKSDVAVGNSSIIINLRDDTADGMKKAMAFLSRHGLKAERMILHDHMPELRSLAKVTPQQAEAIRESLKQIAFWKITLADAAKRLDASDAGSRDFGVSAELNNGTLEMALSGRLDTISAPDLLAFYEKHKGDIRAALVNCEKLDYISSAGLRVLLIMHKGCAGGVTLIGINNLVREILEQTGFDSLLTIDD